MEKFLVIKSCVDCPYFTEGDDYKFDCFCHLSTQKTGHDVGSTYSIPAWCTLPDATKGACCDAKTSA